MPGPDRHRPESGQFLHVRVPHDLLAEVREIAAGREESVTSLVRRSLRAMVNDPSAIDIIQPDE